ncbi:MAG: cytochrome c oxidase subunit 3 [Chloroflexi bacterium]|nr:cytochrome c oxidase subunit 3 [Chloroflexota bacterium]
MTSYVDRQHKAKLGRPSEADLRLKNNRLGMTIFQISWIMVFLAMIIVNWQLRFSYAEWPPAGVAPFDPLLPSAATLALLLSALLVKRALQALRNGRIGGFLMDWRGAMIFGFAFMAVIVYEFASVSDAALATQYGITMRLMTGFHFVHALAILAVMAHVIRNGAAGRYSGDEHDSWAVEGTAKLWYFVTLAWILFYVVLYWIR